MVCKKSMKTISFCSESQAVHWVLRDVFQDPAPTSNSKRKRDIHRRATVKRPSLFSMGQES
ncbi:mCG125822, isoform CRA_a [Mus musculus]|nr:mCG125822, isoform CRA_a [Mus musculus]